MIENNLILAPNSALSPYSKVDTANGMPINGPRIVNSVNNNLRSKEYAERENLKVINGLDMLAYQGAESFSLWEKVDPPYEIMSQELRYGK